MELQINSGVTNAFLKVEAVLHLLPLGGSTWQVPSEGLSIGSQTNLVGVFGAGVSRGVVTVGVTDDEMVIVSSEWIGSWQMFGVGFSFGLVACLAGYVMVRMLHKAISTLNEL